jgi:expansin (peptidoglycan-binding protein)
MRQLTVFVLIVGLSAWSQQSWAVTCDQTIHQGLATYYTFADETGVCGYPAGTSVGGTGKHMSTALNLTDLANTGMCGACIHVRGPLAEITVIVTEACPGCAVGGLDLSPQAWDTIAHDYNGVPPITWQYVPCDVTGPIRYAYYSGSATYWAWVQVRNFRNPIAKFEALMGDGSYHELEVGGWGYYKALNLPDGTQTYRITDIYGQVLVDTGIPVLDEGEVSGAAQFPSCTLSDAGVSSGGATGSGGATASGGATGSGGTTTGSGGTAGSGGATASGGATGSGGTTTGSGGTAGSGGAHHAGGAQGTGGTYGSAGTHSGGGTSGSDSAGPMTPPVDGGLGGTVTEDASTRSPKPSNASGCGCRTFPSSPGFSSWLLGALVVLASKKAKRGRLLPIRRT